MWMPYHKHTPSLYAVCMLCLLFVYGVSVTETHYSHSQSEKHHLAIHIVGVLQWTLQILLIYYYSPPFFFIFLSSLYSDHFNCKKKTFFFPFFINSFCWKKKAREEEWRREDDNTERSLISPSPLPFFTLPQTFYHPFMPFSHCSVFLFVFTYSLLICIQQEAK